MPAATCQERANAIRFLSIDAVQKANSGHPGMPMGMADIAEVLWHDFLQHAPNDPKWVNRDRFVLSNGHGCMLLYALLHLTGYALSIEDIKQFRQLHSKTPGHPEVGETPGVETTTGPLGQGLANAVGMAIAEKHMAATFNRDGFKLINHYTYCFIGDGDLMEGISHEVSSLAGNLGLSKLIVFYDDNGISIDGKVGGWFKENTPKRFEAYGWHVIPTINGHDPLEIRGAILAAQAEIDRPTLICCQTTIGFGSPKVAGTEAAHGAPLGNEEIANVRKKLNWPHPAFEIPAEIYADWDAKAIGDEKQAAWLALFTEYENQYPELAKEFVRRTQCELPLDWAENSKTFIESIHEKKETLATRKASQHALDYFANVLPEVIGGSADLTESNCTNFRDMTVFSADTPAGRYLHYGVREFGMSAIMNGIALYGGLIPYGGTFLTFSDYAKNAIRLSALMKQRVIYVYTHDSIGLGEDGPTHQPIEHLPSLRLIPNLSVWRPCDTVETAVAWKCALERNAPTTLLLSRQALAYQPRTLDQVADIERGAYVLSQTGKACDLILIATGSEVELAVDAAKALAETDGISVRVVSMPSMDVFLAQDAEYQQQVLPVDILPRVAIEAARSHDWYRFVGEQGKVLSIEHFGASAPAKAVYKACGLTLETILHAARDVFTQCNIPLSHLDKAIGD